MEKKLEGKNKTARSLKEIFTAQRRSYAHTARVRGKGGEDS